MGPIGHSDIMPNISQFEKLFRFRQST
jgi:hypothetical protein